MNWLLLQNSLLVAGTTAAAAVVLGSCTALWLATLRPRWRNILLALAAVALALPPFLVTNSWLDLLGEGGALAAWCPIRIYSMVGTIWVLVLMLWPIALFAATSAWQRLEAAQFECEPALTGLGLVRWLLFPAARGELALAAVLIFVLALNNFAVPAILQTKVLPDEMWVRFNTQFDTWGALKTGGPLLIAPILLLIWASRRTVRWPRIQGTVQTDLLHVRLGAKLRTVGAAVAISSVSFSVILPLMQVISARRTWTEIPGAIEAGIGAISNSFWFAIATAMLVSLASLVLAVLCPPRRLTSAVNALAWMVFFVPGVLLGIALIHIFNRPGLVSFYQSVGIVLLAFAMRYAAIGLTATRRAFEGVDADLTDAARLEGASAAQIFRHVEWPQMAPQIAATAYVVYLLCLWDVESMVLVVPPGGETLALRIFNLLHYGHATQVNALCVVLLGLALAPLGLWLGLMKAFGKNARTQNPGSRPTPNLKASIVRCLHSKRGSLALLWSLLFGIWGFDSGCSRTGPGTDTALHSKFFERVEVIGARGVGVGEFNKPRSVAVDQQDNIFAVDFTGRVQKFAPDGKFLLSWQMPETQQGKPKGMGRDHAGNIIVVEPHYQRVNHYTPEGRLVGQWGCKGTNEGCFLLPRGAAENSKHEFFISEYMGAERVQRFVLLNLAAGVGKLEAQLTGTIGKAGTGPGEFNRAEGICVDVQDRIYVADSCNHRIEIFAPDGSFLREYGHAGSGLGELSYPYDIAVDSAGNQFVCEFGNSRIQVFDPNCQPVEIIGRAGVAPGQFSNPWSVALDSHGNLVVADALNHRVQKLVRRESPRSAVAGISGRPENR